MRLTGLSALISSDVAIDRASGSIASGRSGVLVAPVGLRAAAISALAAHAGCTPLVVVTATGREADQLTAALRSWSEGVDMLPSWETLPHERLSPQVDTMARRIAVLRRLAHPVAGDAQIGRAHV